MYEPPALTTEKMLAARIRRYNRLQLFTGLSLACAAAVLGGISLPLLIFVVSFLESGSVPAFFDTNQGITVLFVFYLAGTTGLVIYQPAFFWKEQEEPVVLSYFQTDKYCYSIDETHFILLLLCLAPVLSVLAWEHLTQRIKVSTDCFTLTCRIYDYVKQKQDWLPYPRLESQRTSVKLLAELKLIQTARHFGKIQIKNSSGR